MYLNKNKKILLLAISLLSNSLYAETVSDSISLSYYYATHVTQLLESGIETRINPLPSEVEIELSKFSIKQELLPSTAKQLEALIQSCNLVASSPSTCGTYETVFEYSFQYDHSITEPDITATLSTDFLNNYLYAQEIEQANLDIDIHSQFSFETQKSLVIFKLEIVPTAIAEETVLPEPTMLTMRDFSIKAQKDSNANFNYFYSSFIYFGDSNSPKTCNQPNEMTYQFEQILYCTDLFEEEKSNIDFWIHTNQVALEKDDTIRDYSSSIQSFYIYSNYEIESEVEKTNSGSMSWAYLILLVLTLNLRRPTSNLINTKS